MVACASVGELVLAYAEVSVVSCNEICHIDIRSINE